MTSIWCREGSGTGNWVIHRVGLSLRGNRSEITHTPFPLPIPNILCQTSPMRNLTATICLTIAVLLGSVGMSWSADFQKGLTAYKSGDYATALREWTPLAKQGNAFAQSNLGFIYRIGDGVPKDYKSALKWFRLAAEQGNASAQYNLGVMYRKGQGGPQDAKTALKWFRLAAEQGNASAQYNLGAMYENGLGAPEDFEAAVKWYERSAKQGNKSAQLSLDVCSQSDKKFHRTIWKK
jgi:TPR repeat protein